jgi:hypothetical protein
MNFNKTILSIILLLFCAVSLHAQNEPFTKEQKIDDFEYQYQILEDNYPFFGNNLIKIILQIQ